MPIIDLPQNENQTKIYYNFAILGTLILTGFFWGAYGVWIPFAAAVPLCMLWFWDLFLRPTLMPDTELMDDDPAALMEAEMNRWISGNEHKYEARLNASERRADALASEIEKLKSELAKK